MNIVICDDNKEHLAMLETMTKKVLTKDNIKSFINPTDMYNYMHDILPDLVIMDIVLDGTNGIDEAKRIREICGDAVIIFVSGYADEYIEEVYEVEHIFMVKKPVNEKVYKLALERGREKVKEIQGQTFRFATQRQSYQIPFSKIFFFESDKHNIKITLTDESIVEIPSASMNEIEKILEQAPFVRCHQSFLINLMNYTRASRTEIIYGDIRVPISRRYTDKVKEAISEELRKEIWN